ncbi:NAD(P)-binding protein [Ramaria rubella]|nr:NAD(P)-binding protein [Ramaria rubella]
MSILWQVYDQVWPPRSTFSTDDIPDMSGKVVIVTGGNASIGFLTVKELAIKNAKVYMASRSQAKAEAAIREIKALTGKDVHFLQLDLADMNAIRKSAAEFKSRESHLHVLVNNAGLLASPLDLVTADGYDLQFGTMVLGHFLFTTELLPLLLKTSEEDPKNKPRVINVSSFNHVLVKNVLWDAFKDGPARRALDPQTFYDQSKFGNVVFAYELARRYGDRINVIALHPGTFKSDILKYYGWMKRWILSWLQSPVEFGALTQLYAATTPNADSLSGQYLIPWARVGVSTPLTKDPEIGRQMWEYLESNTRI